MIVGTFISEYVPIVTAVMVNNNLFPTMACIIPVILREVETATAINFPTAYSAGLDTMIVVVLPAANELTVTGTGDGKGTVSTTWI